MPFNIVNDTTNIYTKIVYYHTIKKLRIFPKINSVGPGWRGHGGERARPRPQAPGAYRHGLLQAPRPRVRQTKGSARAEGRRTSRGRAPSGQPDGPAGGRAGRAGQLIAQRDHLAGATHIQPGQALGPAHSVIIGLKP